MDMLPKGRLNAAFWLLLAIGLAIGLCAAGIAVVSVVSDLFSTRPPTLRDFILLIAVRVTLLFLFGSALVGNAYYTQRLERWRRTLPTNEPLRPR